MSGCAGAHCKVQYRAGRRKHLGRVGNRCEAGDSEGLLPHNVIPHHFRDGEGELLQISAGGGLGEGDQASEDVLSNEAASIFIEHKLHAVELFASAAAGLDCGIRRGRQRSNLGQRMFKFANGLLALKTVFNAGIIKLVKVSAKLAQRTNALLPVAINLSNGTLAVDEFLDLGTAEAAFISRLCGGVTRKSVPRAGAAGVAHLRGAWARRGLEKDERVRIFIMPPPVGLSNSRAIVDKQLRQAIRRAFAAGGRKGRRHRRLG